MSTYRVEWPCCGSVTETQAWEPERCPFCKPDAPDPALLALGRELRIRNLIAEREFNTAAANREIAQFGEWRWDHDAADKVCATAIAALLAPDGAASEEVQP